VWRVMAQLSSRLLFLAMDDQREVTVEDLIASSEGPSCGERLKACQETLHPFLTDLFNARGGVRGVAWDRARDPEPVREWLARLAVLLSAVRSEPVREREESGRIGYTPAKHEQPWRVHAVLPNLARGHALVHGRTQLTDEDLPAVARVAVSSKGPRKGSPEGLRGSSGHVPKRCRQSLLSPGRQEWPLDRV
jgi:hypothetical protein